MARTRLALSIGCPSGIGPEVAVVAAARADVDVVLVGDFGVIARAAELRKVGAHFLPIDDPSSRSMLPPGVIGVFQPTPSLAMSDARYGKPSIAGGAAQLAWIDSACDLVSFGGADALVTGPVSKEAIVRSRAQGSRGFIGHTEHLQKRLRSKDVVMAFYGETFSTALVTTHMALAQVPRAITKSTVEQSAYFLGDFLLRLAKKNHAPRLAVAGLNPHAGEHGLFGKEDMRAIAPAVKSARARFAKERRKIEIAGPVPAETAFRLAARAEYDGVVAMYHDQATIPMKVASFGEAVNVSLALPIIRTSVDHGTAYDIAGNATADASGMRAAIDLAVRLVNADAASPSRAKRAATSKRPQSRR
ncbi:MAG: 4-hydroxythreonine-4-phosphate dehydrogenase PdxA [Polyangiaceae bacterium]